MSNETQITVRGNVGSDPKLHVGTNGGKVVRISVAVSSTKFRPDTGEFETSPPQWFAVKVFGHMAENVTASVQKGTPVIVRGELVTETWKAESGEDRSMQVIRADAFGIDLRHGTASYTKVVRGSALGAEADAELERRQGVSTFGTESSTEAFEQENGGPSLEAERVPVGVGVGGEGEKPF